MMFDHLAKPFTPGMVIPSNRNDREWHFTFRDATGNEYYWRVSDLPSAVIAKQKMRVFCATVGENKALSESF